MTIRQKVGASAAEVVEYAVPAVPAVPAVQGLSVRGFVSRHSYDECIAQHWFHYRFSPLSKGSIRIHPIIASFIDGVTYAIRRITLKLCDPINKSNGGVKIEACTFFQFIKGVAK